MNRKYLKQQAKDLLKLHYWKIFALLLMVSILSFKFIGFSSETVYSYDYSYVREVYYLEFLVFKFPLQPSPLLISILMISGLAGFIFSIFFVSVLNYGKENKLVYYAMGRENEFDLFDGFRRNYKNIVMTNFMAGLYIALWSLLLVIPGVIKAYEYYYVNQILCEHPDWNWRKVLKESKRMTYGNKWNLFVLELSFILWHLLGLFTAGISEYFLEPYIKMTYAYAYLYVKSETTPNDYIDIIVNENNF